MRKNFNRISVKKGKSRGAGEKMAATGAAQATVLAERLSERKDPGGEKNQ